MLSETLWSRDWRMRWRSVPVSPPAGAGRCSASGSGATGRRGSAKSFWPLQGVARKMLYVIFQHAVGPDAGSRSKGPSRVGNRNCRQGVSGNDRMGVFDATWGSASKVPLLPRFTDSTASHPRRSLPKAGPATRPARIQRTGFCRGTAISGWRGCPTPAGPPRSTGCC